MNLGATQYRVSSREPASPTVEGVIEVQFSPAVLVDQRFRRNLVPGVHSDIGRGYPQADGGQRRHTPPWVPNHRYFYDNNQGRRSIATTCRSPPR